MTTARTVGAGQDAPAAVRLDTVDGVARICFDRPPVNAFTLDMLENLRALMDTLRAEPRPVLLTGANGVFSAGFDIKQPGVDADGATSRAAASACLETIQVYPAPVIAAVEGAAVGLGLLLAASADVLVISRTARVRMPEVTLGIVSDVAPLRRLLPEPWVRRICLLGELFTASDLQLEGAAATLCDPGCSEQVATTIVASVSDIDVSFLERTKRRLAE